MGARDQVAHAELLAVAANAVGHRFRFSDQRPFLDLRVRVAAQAGDRRRRQQGRRTPLHRRPTRLETSEREERYTVARPVWETQYRDASYNRVRTVCETSEREERYSVQRPVWETSEREERTPSAARFGKRKSG